MTNLFTSGAGFAKHFATIFHPLTGEYDILRKHPEADATVLDAARLVEASVDANEPVLVSVLQEAAGAYHRRGDSAAAEACVQRARAVVEAHPDPGDKREVLRKLDQQLALVRTPSRTRAAAPK